MDRHLLIPGLEHIKAEPDAQRLKETLLRRRVPERVPFMELFQDEEVRTAIWGRPPTTFAELAELQMRLGYDSVGFGITPDFPSARESAPDTAILKRGERTWVMAGLGVIKCRDDFERYPWPGIDPSLESRVAQAAEALPRGMGLLLQSSGILENLMWIMSYEGLSEALYDDPQLVRDVVDRIGNLILRSYERVIECDRAIGAFFGDDMGFRTATMISPKHMREFIFPWQKKVADLCHERGMIFVLHSCGNLEGIMEDLISYVGIDAKHSYEDSIEPVGSFKRRYGHRIGVVGGLDVDKLARSSADEVARYARSVLEECAPGSGYAFGSGNSVTNYIPLDNYFAMLREAWNFRIAG